MSDDVFCSQFDFNWRDLIRTFLDACYTSILTAGEFDLGFWHTPQSNLVSSQFEAVVYKRDSQVCKIQKQKHCSGETQSCAVDLQLCSPQGRITPSATRSPSSEVTKQPQAALGVCSLFRRFKKKVKVMQFSFYLGQTFLDNHLWVSLISIEVHFSVDYFNNCDFCQSDSNPIH